MIGDAILRTALAAAVVNTAAKQQHRTVQHTNNHTSSSQVGTLAAHRRHGTIHRQDTASTFTPLGSMTLYESTPHANFEVQLPSAWCGKRWERDGHSKCPKANFPYGFTRQHETLMHCDLAPVPECTQCLASCRV